MTVADFLVRGLGADRDLNALTIADIERYAGLRSRVVSRNSLQHVVAHLKGFLRFCHDQVRSAVPWTPSRHLAPTAANFRHRRSSGPLSRR